MKKILEFLRHIKLPSIPSLKRPGRPGQQAPRGREWRPSLPLIAVSVAAIGAAAGVFSLARSLTECWRMTALPGIAPAHCTGTMSNALGTPVISTQDATFADAPPTPVVAAPEVEYPKWDGGSRVNIVFFGLRGGDPSEEDCPLCTDTIMVFTIDPISKTAGMISVPRDLYVNIPGTDGCSGAHDGFCRINTAWTAGEALQLPGGGPGLAMRTVSLVLGVPIHYYAQVDFDTFVQLVHLIGGIDVYNDQDLFLKKLGGGKDTIHITCCGIRHLSGQAALAYARCRKPSQGCTDGDVGRAHRQQQVIMGIRNQVLNPENFPTLMAQAPEIYNTFQGGIRTNMALDDGLRLAALVREIPLDQIQQGVIDDHMVNYGNVTLAGQDAAVLLPIPDKIRELRDQIFTASGPTSPIAQGDPQALMQADGARVEVTNDSFNQGLDQRTGNFLLAQGMQVVSLGAPTGASDTTVVVIHSPRLYALRYLIQPLGMISTSRQIVFEPDPSSPVDIEIRLGNDWLSKLPAGY